MALIGLAATVSFAGWKSWRWPSVSSLAHDNPKTTAFMEGWKARERAAGRSGDPEWIWVPYQRISPHLKRAILVSEDINFFSHRGFEIEEIRAAMKEAVTSREMPRGASTLTQQLAKNLWLSPSRSPLRKVEEAILTRQLERELNKERIFEIYLNVVEFGPGVWGAEAAARHYFGKPASTLDENEAARMAAALPSPDRWHPGSESRTAIRRADRIRRRMERAEFLWKQI
jgi:monofunctional biosynthetic peptidoglycan transglycosylase